MKGQARKGFFRSTIPQITFTTCAVFTFDYYILLCAFCNLQSRENIDLKYEDGICKSRLKQTIGQLRDRTISKKLNALIQLWKVKGKSRNLVQLSSEWKLAYYNPKCERHTLSKKVRIWWGCLLIENRVPRVIPNKSVLVLSLKQIYSRLYFRRLL